MRLRCEIACLLLLLLFTPLRGQAPALVEQTSGVTVVLQAIGAVNDSAVWVGGHGGVILRTLNGGRTWARVTAPGGDSLQFRDVHAVSADTAFVLSAGPGAMSRIYKTADAGVRWDLQFRNRDSSAFYDCFDFWEPRHGLAVSDAVGGHIVVIETLNGGGTWEALPPERLPEAPPGEGGFAASGTCLLTRAPNLAWIGTGAEGQGKVYRSTDGGHDWSVTTVPFRRGSGGAGVTTLAFRDARHGAALGGDIGAPDSTGENVALTADGGRTWLPGGRPPFPGPVYGAAYVLGMEAPVLVAAGPRGLALSRDDGRTWALLSRENYWAVAFAGPGVGWAVGVRGRITRIEMGPH